MKHAQIQEQLAVYRYLSPDEREQVDRHVGGCAECAARLRDYHALDRQVAALRLPRPAPRVRERFYQAIESGRVKGDRRSALSASFGHVSRALSLVAGAGAVLLLILALWITYQAFNNSAAPAGRPTATPLAGQPVLEWTKQSAGECRAAAIGGQGEVAFGACAEQKRTTHILAEMQRPEELEYFVGQYQSFEAETPAGHIKLVGQGSRAAAPAEQRAVAEWAALVYQEAEMGRSGASWGLALAIVQDGANACSRIEIKTYGWAFGQDCSKGMYPLNPRWLNATEDEMLFGLLDHFQSLEMTWNEGNVPVRLIFSGTGSIAASEAERAEIRAMAEAAYTRLRADTPPSVVEAPPSEDNPYPFAPGTTWVYQSTRYEGMNTGAVMTATTTITETVVDIRTDPNFGAAKIRRETGAETPIAGPADLQQQLLRKATTSEYWLVVKDKRIYKQASEPDPSKLTDNDALEFVFPLKPDEKWVWQPASPPEKPLTQGVFRQVMDLRTLDLAIGQYDNCALIKDGWNTDTSFGWFCPGVGWVEHKSDHNGTPYGSHEVLVKYQPGGSARQATPAPTPTTNPTPANPQADPQAVLDMFMQARIQRQDQAVLGLLTDAFRARVNAGGLTADDGPFTQVSNPCWYRYQVLESRQPDAAKFVARVRVYQHFWPGDNAGGLPRSWEQQVTLVNTAQGWRVDALGKAENEREQPGEPHGPTLSACNAAAAPATPAATAVPAALAWSPNGNSIAVATSAGIVLYDPNTGRAGRTIDEGEASSALAWSADSNRVVCICGSGGIKVWDLKSGKLLGTYTRDEGAYTSIAFSPDGKYMAAGTDGGTVRVWDTNDATPVKTFLRLNTSVPAIIFTADSRQIVAAYETGGIDVWTIANGEMREINISGSLTVLSPDGTRAAIADASGGMIQIWDLVNVRPLGVTKPASISTFLFTSDSRQLVVNGPAGATVHDAANGQALGLLSPEDLSSARLLAFSPDGKKAAAVASDGTLRGVDWQVAPAQAAASPEDEVWQAVKRQAGTSITPLLKPGSVPSDLSSVQMLNAGPGTFEVEYRGTGRTLDISVTTLQPPDLGANGSRTAVTVRGQPATLQQQRAGAGGKMWLWWDEPGKWIPVEGGDPRPAVTYTILAAGLSPDEVQQAAASMTPL